MLAGHLRETTPIPGVLAEWFYAAVHEASWHDKDYVKALAKELGLMQKARGRPSKSRSRIQKFSPYGRANCVRENYLGGQGPVCRRVCIDDTKAENIYYAFRRFEELVPR